MKRVVGQTVKMVISLSLAVALMIVGGLGGVETGHASASVSGVPQVVGMTDDFSAESIFLLSWLWKKAE